MTELHNEITINAPVEKLWGILANLEALQEYDPVILSSTATSMTRSGSGAERKCRLRDNKNWYEEKVTEWKPNEALTYELTKCSFPIHQLKHSYSFEPIGNQTKVKQIMKYQVKYGFLGCILDKLIIRKQTDNGIKKFFARFKEYAEK